VWFHGGWGAHRGMIPGNCLGLARPFIHPHLFLDTSCIGNSIPLPGPVEVTMRVVFDGFPARALGFGGLVKALPPGEVPTGKTLLRPSTLHCAILNRPVLRGRILFNTRPWSGSTSMRRLRFISEHTTIEVIVWTLIAIDFVIVLFVLAK